MCENIKIILHVDTYIGASIITGENVEFGTKQ